MINFLGRVSPDTKQRLVPNAMLLILNAAIFIKVNTNKEKFKIKKILCGRTK